MTRTRRSHKIVTLLAALAFTGAALAGCSTQAPSSESSGQPSGGSTESPTYATNEEFQLAFAACMREQGIDMPDPTEGGTQVDAGSGDGFQQAAELCMDELGAPPSGSGDAQPSERQREVFLEMAQCFRDNGIDVPDPAPGESLAVPMDAPQEVFDACATAAENSTGGAP